MRHEIHQLRNDVSREIENERNPQQNEPNNADGVIEGEHADLPHNIIPPEENAIEQPNEINENELLKIKKTLVNAYAKSIVTPFDKRFNLRKPGRKTIKKLEESLEKVNDVIEATPLLTEKIDVTSLNQLTYATAITAIKTTRVENECIIKKRNNRRKGDWTFNMNRRINEPRADISKISQMNDPRPSPKMKRNTNSMKTKYQIVDEQTRSTSLETLKQRLYALSNRLSRYQRRQKQYQQNNDFINKQSKLFDELRGNRITIMDPPTMEDIEKFWKPLYENKKEYNRDAPWLQKYKTSVNNITEATYSEITTKKIESAIFEFSNRKSPGLDKLHNFWWNKLTTLHPKVAVAFDKLIVQPENCPDWLTTGQTTLIAKKKPSRNPSNY